MNEKPNITVISFETLSNYEGNWKEDFGYQNAQYITVCNNCNHSFLGHKQRAICKKCTVTLLVIEANKTKLIQLRVKIEFYKKLDKKIDKVLNGELEIEEWSSEVCGKINKLESELTDLKIEMDLSDAEWDDTYS